MTPIFTYMKHLKLLIYTYRCVTINTYNQKEIETMTTYISINTDFNNYKTKYFKIPVEIMESKLIKAVDKLIYSLLRNRMNLSIKHNTYDERGYFIFYPQQALANEVGVTKKTIVDAFKRLIKANMVHCEGEGNANRIYLTEYVTEMKHRMVTKVAPEVPKKIETPVIDNSENSIIEPDYLSQIPPLAFYTDFLGIETTPSLEKSESFVGIESALNGIETTQVGVDSSIVGVETTPNYLYNNTINKPVYKSIYHSSSISKLEIERVRERYYDQLDMACMLERYSNNELLEEIFEIVVDMHLSVVTVVNKQEKPVEVVRSVLAKLNHMHIENVMETYQAVANRIELPHAYLKTLIYNTGISLKAKMDNRYMSDARSVANQRVEQPSRFGNLLDDDMFYN